MSTSKTFSHSELAAKIYPHLSGSTQVVTQGAVVVQTAQAKPKDQRK